MENGNLFLIKKNQQTLNLLERIKMINLKKILKEILTVKNFLSKKLKGKMEQIY